MKTKLKVENPDAVELTLTLTLPLSRWKQLREQVNAGDTYPYPYPKNALIDAIRELTNKAEAHFISDTISEE